jgi:plasmid maintenance system antidote protein VapI
VTTQEKEVLLEELFDAKLQCSRLQEKLDVAREDIAELLAIIKKKNAMIDRMQIRIDQGAEL